MKIVVLAGDVVPGMGVPVAAPGIRAWGLALGLRAHGHEVTVVVDPRSAAAVWPGGLPPPIPAGTILLAPKRVPQWVGVHNVDAVVVSSPRHADLVSDVDCRLVVDFFAPRMLEIAQNVARDDREAALAKLELRKLAALARADDVIVNGAKKLDYVRGWLRRAGSACDPVVVNPGVPSAEPTPAEDGDLHLMIGGYLQPWSKPGAVAQALHPILDAGGVRLHLLLGEHWGQVRTGVDHAPELRALAEHPATVTHGLLRFGDFRRLLSRMHLTVDVFAHNPERELAMVTRSVVALSCGVPVLHVPFTEVSPWLQNYDAGWLVDPAAADQIATAVNDASSGGARVRAVGARRVARNVLDPVIAAAPLHELLGSA